MVVRVAQTLRDAEGMRCARNACREFMTRNTAEISRDEQIEWFSRLDTNTVIPFVARLPAEDLCVGYGLLRQIDGRWWISGGLLPAWRGKGLGKQLFAELTQRVHLKRKPAWLEVRKDNGPAERVYRGLGYVQVEELDYAIVMRKDP